MCCIKRLPQDGPLLTAQSPFFPVFLMAIVSYTPEDRAVACEWFEAVVSNGGRSVSMPMFHLAHCRSNFETQNVPPVWHAVQLLWTWLDKTLNRSGDIEHDEDTPVGLRKAWWEDTVEYLIGEVGLMSLT